MANPSKFTWVDPVTNTDGSAITAGEIASYQIGIRPSTGTVGTYPTLVPVPGATSTSEPLSAIVPPLAAGSYAAAIQTVGPVNSPWSSEITFTIAETPSPPSSFSVS